MKNIFYCCWLVTFVLFACGSGGEDVNAKSHPSSVKTKVTFAAGQSLPMESDRGFLSLPFNIAVDVATATHPFVIISDELKVSSTIHVIPIGAIVIDDDGAKIEYIIAVPSKDKRRTIPVDNFYEFSTVYSGAKWIIEQYFLNYKGLGRVKLISWEDEQFANQILNSTDN